MYESEENELHSLSEKRMKGERCERKSKDEMLRMSASFFATGSSGCWSDSRILVISRVAATTSDDFRRECL